MKKSKCCNAPVTEYRIAGTHQRKEEVKTMCGGCGSECETVEAKEKNKPIMMANVRAHYGHWNK